MPVAPQSTVPVLSVEDVVLSLCVGVVVEIKPPETREKKKITGK